MWQTNNILYHLIRAMRPRQWTKNASLFAAAIFSGALFDGVDIYRLAIAAVLFSLLSSATYLINDVKDAERDALHPIKKNRPIPSGRLSKGFALSVALALVVFVLLMSVVFVNIPFFAICIIYLLLQISYSIYLRNIIIVDALTVAVGFIVRVFAGGFAADVSISSWIILSTIGLSLLLAFGKRRSERTILGSQDIAFKTRATLKSYPDSLLDSMISMSASYTMIAYSIFCFQTGVRSDIFLNRYLPTTLSSPKWLMITIPLVIYGVARYLYVIYEKRDAESPERVLMSDIPLLVSVLMWGILAFAIIY
ncbi:decaprenyl-phosphate phosphoribosyltransferase [candidate division WWE3 bacterium CG08_land_8_20_14_0_20_40_13]|uniref:Decaprenyl-phosphate phosphoribosyltransferase n=1 Tax=candidate division WWE3 bacterium CG08_land_8_20_14_0_20_40_13 TaxID=1975084 RepID=A0A2H0XE70_UNCKA|nr:MAG: decaprenyl-phosphate phosphoribosyltransferase [candidate division WWE3 bacterium CG08_land_8_20_14_0_20_40_13]